MNILIADDHELYSLGLKSILNEISGITIDSVDCCSNGKHVLTKLNGDKKYNYLLTDLNMPELDGNELIEILHEKFPSLKIIVISMYYSYKMLEVLKTYGVCGFIPKGIEESKMKKTLAQVLKGENLFITTNHKDFIIIKSDFKINADVSFLDTFEKKYNLTTREQEIAVLMVSDFGNSEIAEKLFLSVETIKSYRKNIYTKTGVNNVLSLYKLMKHNQLID